MKNFITTFIICSLFVPCLFFIITSIFLILDFFFQDFFGLENALEILGDNYIINGEEIKLINNLFSTIQAITNFILYSSLCIGLLGSFFAKKIQNNLFDNSSVYASSVDNNSFSRGFIFGGLILPSVIILALCIFCYSIPNPILPVVPEGIALDIQTIDNIIKYSDLIQVSPLIFLFTGASFGVMFMLANKASESYSPQ